MMGHSAAAMIETKGGPTVFAAAIGAKADAVRMMKYRGRIPRSVWPEIQKAFPDVSLDDLLATESDPDRERTPEPASEGASA